VSDHPPVEGSEEPTEPIFTAAEFFAGVGLVRLGLEQAGFRVVWANDIEPAKQEMYTRHFGKGDQGKFVLGDVADVDPATLPAGLTLAWASFPCTDLSLAGGRSGLKGTHSSTFWGFIEALRGYKALHGAAPPLVAVENVVGLATSHGGADLAKAIDALNELDYSVDIMTLDARRWVPQSRPRLFLVGAREVPKTEDSPDRELRPAWLDMHYELNLLDEVGRDPRMHRAALPPLPPLKTDGLADIVVQMSLSDKRWWDTERTNNFLSQLSEVQKDRLDDLIADRVSYRTAYRRTRGGVPAWEIRKDEVAGCLRTARGGSSKQALVRVGNGEVRVRWMLPREYARLMGADNYKLNGVRDNQAFFGFGDAVCVPAVAWLAEHYLKPLAAGKTDLTGSTASSEEPSDLTAARELAAV
jgi:DNA (cytosine-5)-methyltransferase 1